MHDVHSQRNSTSIFKMDTPSSDEPRLKRSHTLHFIGDWGQANFHRICSWLTQEFCDRAGPRSRTAIWSIRGGGLEALTKVHDGEADLGIVTPAALMRKASTGDAPFPYPMSNLRALAVLPQNDRLVLAIDPKHQIRNFEELRQKKPALKIATSVNDGTNYIGYVASQFMEAHGITNETLTSWGAKYITDQRPDQSLDRVKAGEVDAVLQEAIMTPWWRELIEANVVMPLPAEPAALETLSQKLGMRTNALPARYWKNVEQELPALDFSDFVLVVRDDMPEEVARLLTWAVVETRGKLEAQYKHIPPAQSPLSYPLDPKAMTQTPFPLHAGAQAYYKAAGYL